jgi:hypothetical protein
MPGHPSYCPKCKGGKLRKADPLKRHVNIIVWLLGGWIMSILWSCSRGRRMRCEECDHEFDQTSAGRQVAGVLLLLFISWAIYLLIADYLDLGDEQIHNP